MTRDKPTRGPYRFDRAKKEILSPAGVTVAVPHGPAGPWIDVASEHDANGRLLAASWELHRQVRALTVQIDAAGLIVPPAVKAVLDSIEKEPTSETA